LIPYLNITESRQLAFFQDTYFKKIYPKEYLNTKITNRKQTSKVEMPFEYYAEVIDDLYYIMNELKIYCKIKIRKKTYFSLYNKLQRHDVLEIDDSM